MQELKDIVGVTAYCAPLAVALAGSVLVVRAPRNDRTYSRIAPALALAALVLSLLATVLTAAARLGPFSFGDPGNGVGVRIDVVSLSMLTLVTFIGWIVVRFATTFMRGEEERPRFLGWLMLTLAAVCLLVTAGGLVQLVIGWSLASLALHKLLLFYPDRPAARRAAGKKFIVARASDLMLLVAAGLLFLAYGSLDIGAILERARLGEGGVPAVVAAGFLALAAVLKSAQFPFHGWLTESIEAPTPVSALLHAGVINAGGFLLIRFADVLLLAPGVLAALATIGGLTALFGGLVMLTQPAVKTSLAWSTVGQMGFMIFQCGLGLFPIALLHILAHSLYKAHAFLASGQAVEGVAATLRPGPVAIPGARAVGLAFLAALSIYAALGFAFGFADKSAQAIALGAILVLGVAYMLAQGFADKAPAELTRRTAGYAVAATVSYFLLQAGMTALTDGVLPSPPPARGLEWTIIGLAMLSFGLVAVTQAMFPLWSDHPAAAGLRIHLANGLYVNAVADRLGEAWRRPLTAKAKKGAA
jgi:NAD(P)H-quinone oxidoreductase subunit 5